MEDWASRFKDLFGQVGFDRAFAGIEIVSAGAGKAEARLTVNDAVRNLMGMLHGGAIATLVDDIGTLAVITIDRGARPGVSTDLNVSFFAPAPLGTVIVIRAEVLKTGKTLSFVTVDLRRETDGALVAQGRMTKFLG